MYPVSRRTKRFDIIEIGVTIRAFLSRMSAQDMYADMIAKEKWDEARGMSL